MPVITLNDSLSRVDPPATPLKSLDDLYPTATQTVESKFEGSTSVPVQGTKLAIKSTAEHLSVSGDSKHHLMNAILHAYNTHQGLRLSPDDLLQCFAAVAAQCVNEHSDKYRDVFVNHQGQKQLVVVADTPPGQFDWNMLLNMMSVAIDQNVKTSLGLDSDFTTSTTVSRSVAQLMKMATFQKYFTYMFMLGCGIRQVDLTGTLQDWLALRVKVERCCKIFTDRGNMVNWSKHFLAVLSRLIETMQCGIQPNAARHAADSKAQALPKDLELFWSRVITYVPYGSGGQQFISGWAKVLFPGSAYDKFPDRLNLLDCASAPPQKTQLDYYSWQDRMKSWAQLVAEDPVGITTVPAELDDHGLRYQLWCTAGHIGWTVSDGFAEARLGYVVHAASSGKQPADESQTGAAQAAVLAPPAPELAALQDAHLDAIVADQSSRIPAK